MLKTTLLSFCCLLALAASAQLEYQLDAEVTRNFYIDTTWCKANNVDLIKIKVYHTDHKKGKGRYDAGYLITMKNGQPQYHLYMRGESNDTIRPYKPKYVADIDTTYKTMYGYNKASNTIVNLNQSDSSYRYYKKYYQNDRLTKLIEVSGNKTRRGVFNSGQVTHYDYYPNGYPKSFWYTYINEDERIPMEEYSYINGVIVKSVFYIDYGNSFYCHYTSEFTYYSKGKKIPVQ